MSQFYLLLFVVLVFANPAQKEYEKWSRSDYGLRVMKQLETLILETDSSPSILLNQLEKDLVANLTKEITAFQTKQKGQIALKHQLKQETFLHKQQIKMLNVEIEFANRSLIMADELLDRRSGLQADFSKMVHQAQALKTDEDDQVDLDKPLLEIAKQFVGSSRKIFDEVKSKAVSMLKHLDDMEGQDLNGQSQFDKRKGMLKPERDVEEVFREVCQASARYMQQSVRKVPAENPYASLVASFIMLLDNNNADILTYIPQVLEKISNEINDNLEDIQAQEFERQSIFSEKKQQFRAEQEKINAQDQVTYLENIDKFYTELLESARKQQLIQTSNLEDAQQRMEQIQTNIDEETKKHNEYYHEQMDHLALLRRMKNQCYASQDQFIKIIQQIQY